MDRYSHWDFIPSLVYSGVWFMLGSVEIGFTAIHKITISNENSIAMYLLQLQLNLKMTQINQG